jgi:hypothetical protein
MTDVTIKRALLSVSDKSGLVELGQALGKHASNWYPLEAPPRRCARLGWR